LVLVWAAAVRATKNKNEKTLELFILPKKARLTALLQ